jgi:catechol 2,3-dioxygenase-like lactoylglutathione lyase family enzyme
MKPCIKVITLGVADLETSLAFYRDGLGLSTQGIIGTEFEDGAVVFFNMNEDLILALYPKASLAKDAKVPLGPSGPADLSLGHIVGSRQEVDAVMLQASRAGAHVTDAACDRFWGGYSGEFPGSGRSSVGNCLESSVGSKGINTVARGGYPATLSEGARRGNLP